MSKNQRDEDENQGLKKVMTEDIGLDLTKTMISPNDNTEGKHVSASDLMTTEEEKENPEEKKKDTKKLLLLLSTITVILLLLAGVTLYTFKHKEPVTIDGLHSLNIKGKLDPDQGYMYHGYSFVKYSDLWYTQVQKGKTVYDVTFNYDPKSVENIPVEGVLTKDFVKNKKLWITFDPDSPNLKWVAIANYGLSRSLAWAFGYDMEAGCTKNITKACADRVVECGDPDKAVIYLKQANDTRVILAENCVIVQGEGENLVKAKDRLLLRWYGILDPVGAQTTNNEQKI